MFYYVTGFVSFEINSFYHDVLNAWLWKEGLENKIELKKETLHIDGLLDLDGAKDIFSFLNQYALIKNANIKTTKKGINTHSFLLNDNLIYEYQYDYNRKESINSNFDHFIDTLKNTNFSVKIEFLKCTISELNLLEQALLAIQKNDTDLLDEAIDHIKVFVKKRKYIELITEKEKVLLKDAELKVVIVSPYQLINKPEQIEIKKPKLSNYIIDGKEKRLININNIYTPLDPLFMEGKDDKNVILPNGHKTTSCSQCVFRLRKVTGSCSPCQPQKLHYKQKK